MKNDLGSTSAVIAMSSFDLAAVSGGQGGAELVGRPLPTHPAQEPPPPPAAQPNLTCPPGTSPNWLRVTGEVDVNGSVISGRVNGTVENFWCTPV
jgi:hypothetical protein